MAAVLVYRICHAMPYGAALPVAAGMSFCWSLFQLDLLQKLLYTVLSFRGLLDLVQPVSTLQSALLPSSATVAAHPVAV